MDALRSVSEQALRPEVRMTARILVPLELTPRKPTGDVGNLPNRRTDRARRHERQC